MGKRVACGVVVLLLVAAACSNSKKTTTTERGGGSGGSGGGGKKVAVNAPGVTDTEIRVGGVASVTNPLGGKYADAFAGVNAYFNMINSEGGIYGRKLKLVAQRDDKTGSNQSQVQALLSQDNVFAVMPIATLLFTGADTLVSQNVPAFGWLINPEWEGDAKNPKKNLFGQAGSFLCFDCEAPNLPFLAKKVGAKNLGVLAYNVSQSAECATGIRKTFDRWGKDIGTKVAFVDSKLSFGVTDLSVQVSKMKEAGVDMVTTCMDLQGVVTLAKELKKQDLKAVQYIPNGYDTELTNDFGDLFEGSYVLTFFTPFETEKKPPGLEKYLDWIKRSGATPSENSIDAWLNAALFVDGLKAAGPRFDRQRVIDAINSFKNWTADGLLSGVDWTIGHTQVERVPCGSFSKVVDGKFEPAFVKPGKPFICFDRESRTAPEPTLKS